jgi:hypothetical protein
MDGVGFWGKDSTLVVFLCGGSGVGVVVVWRYSLYDVTVCVNCRPLSYASEHAYMGHVRNLINLGRHSDAVSLSDSISLCNSTLLSVKQNT